VAARTSPPAPSCTCTTSGRCSVCPSPRTVAGTTSRPRRRYASSHCCPTATRSRALRHPHPRPRTHRREPRGTRRRGGRRFERSPENHTLPASFVASGPTPNARRHSCSTQRRASSSSTIAPVESSTMATCRWPCSRANSRTATASASERFAPTASSPSAITRKV